jgi:hypothetical protein
MVDKCGETRGQAVSAVSSNRKQRAWRFLAGMVLSSKSQVCNVFNGVGAGVSARLGPRCLF